MSLLGRIALASAVHLGSISIEHVRVVDGQTPPRDDMTVVIEGSHIAAIGKQPPAAGSTRIDGRGRVLSPSLWAVSSHAGLLTVDDVPDAEDASADGLLLAPELRALDGFNPAASQLAQLRLQGVGQVLLLPTGRLIAGQAALVELSTGAAGLPPRTPVALVGGVAGIAGLSRAHAWKIWREALAELRRSFKSVPPPPQPLLRPQQLEALAPLLRRRLPLMLWLDRAADIAQAVAWAEQEGLRLMVIGGAEAHQVAPLLARAQVPVLLRPSMQQVGDLNALAARLDAATLLHAAGVQLVITSQGELAHEDLRLRQEAGLAVRFGLPYTAALAAISSTPAQLWAAGEAVGQVAVGQRANLVLWSGDPLEVRSVSEQIWIGGVQQPRQTRQSALVQRYLAARP